MITYLLVSYCTNIEVIYGVVGVYVCLAVNHIKTIWVDFLHTDGEYIRINNRLIPVLIFYSVSNYSDVTTQFAARFYIFN